ncbi:MAG: GIY-YIG nuclease family protein [Pseudomonadota bacterium]
MNSRPDQNWFLYLVRCKNQTLYTGISTDVERRFQSHQSQDARCAKYLRGKQPLTLAYVQEIGLHTDALRAEAVVKKLPKNAKEQLVSGKLNIKEVLQ